MARTASPAGEGVQVVSGSVLDREAVRRALRGCASVYHLAGRVSRRREDAADLFRIHVDGTRILCEEAAAAGVRRIVLVSTSGTVAVSDDPDRVSTEGDGEALDAVRRWPYYLSKLYQEREALAACKKAGVELVIVNPSLLLGPGDDRESSTGDVARFLRREIPLVPPGGLSFVDARDVAEALPGAMERGVDGQRYLLGAANWTLARFFERLEQLSGVAAPRFALPPRLGPLSGRLVAALDALGGRAPIDPISEEMSRCFWYVDSRKAQREIGFAPRDPSETLLDTIREIREKA
jgi:dihydroflavonol-4-reductase